MLIDHSFGHRTYPEKILLLIFVWLGYFSSSYAQNTLCNLPGQQPSTAIFLCEDTVYTVRNLPICKEVYRVEPPGCYNFPLRSPFYFRFRCYRTGLFGFRFHMPVQDTLKRAGQNWAVYDITGKNPDDVYTNPNWIVMYNFPSNPRGDNVNYTGAAPFGRSTRYCGDPADTTDAYCNMLDVKAGREYLLLISSGGLYDTSFILELGLYNSSAVVVNPGIPSVKSTKLDCDGKKLQLTFNKLLDCNSLASDGSDFSLSAELNQITSASVRNCIEGFMDTIELTFNQPLPPGDYVMFTQKGSDGNTLYDACGNNLAEDTRIEFKVLPARYVELDTVAKPGCLPASVRLSFAEPVSCNSIAQNGSDFKVSGPAVVNVISAGLTCLNGFTKEVELFFDQPISDGGLYTIELAKGTDNNTIFGDCGIGTPIGSSTEFNVTQSVNPGFNYTILDGCRADTVKFLHTSNDAAVVRTWKINEQVVNQSSAFSEIFTKGGEQKVELTVANEVCSTSASQSFMLEDKIKAAFEYPKFICPEDRAEFKDKSTGKLKSWHWNFDNGYTSNQAIPGAQKLTAESNNRVNYNIQLVVTDINDCADTAYNKVEVLKSCYVTVPNAFTPNHDTRNDWLCPLNTHKARQLEFAVYNRYGQMIFRTFKNDGKWDGTLNGQPQPPGIYIWKLSYTDADSGKRIVKNGSSLLLR